MEYGTGQSPDGLAAGFELEPEDSSDTLAIGGLESGALPTGLKQILSLSAQEGCTDVHLKADDHPIFRVHGILHRVRSHNKLNADELRSFANSIMTSPQRRRLEVQGDCDLGLDISDLASFRVNVYVERGTFGIALRVIPLKIPSFTELGLPVNVCQDLALRPRGLVLITGPTGSGKTTTLAAMVDYLNDNCAFNIITIEDPIEYRHVNKRSVISQRQVGNDTKSFYHALRSALRQDPDVLLVGEMRDLETIRIALTAAETGHLVLCTLHTNSAVASIDRIIDVFPAHQQAQVRHQLAMTIEGVLSQALLPATKESLMGRVVAVEVMLANHAVRNLIREGKTHQVYTAIQSGARVGMRTFDADLISLVSNGRISAETAQSVCHNPNDFRAELKEIRYS